ncbi:MAG: hypothetical protein IPP74_11325 [Alphaproteobacteria bacterium]|nr:hypothetical protein [Alphaproteobacteria bacterium]
MKKKIVTWAILVIPVLLVVILGSMMGFSFASTKTNKPVLSDSTSQWGAFLHHETIPEDLEKANPLVFSYETHPPLQSYIDRNKTLLAELNVIDVASGELGYERAEDSKLMMGPSNRDASHMLVDIRKADWKQYLIESKLQSLLLRRFQGVYIDSLHEARELEARDPKRYAGMVASVVEVIKAIRYQYPSVIIAVDYDETLTPQLLPVVQYVIADSIITTPDAIARPAQESMRALRLLGQWKHQYPQLTVLVKEQWNQDDSKGQADLANKIRQNGFVPFVRRMADPKVVLRGK